MTDRAATAPKPRSLTTPILGALFLLAAAAFFVGFWMDDVVVRLVSKPIPVLALIRRVHVEGYKIHIGKQHRLNILDKHFLKNISVAPFWLLSRCSGLAFGMAFVDAIHAGKQGQRVV